MLQFVSTLAVGFFAAAVIAVGAADYLPIGRTGSGFANLDYGSVGLGLVLGVLISSFARIGWAEIPNRIVGYIVSQRGTLRLIGWGAVFAAVLLLY